MWERTGIRNFGELNKRSHKSRVITTRRYVRYNSGYLLDDMDNRLCIVQGLLSMIQKKEGKMQLNVIK